ncbi:14223_t:CDS:1, partial [Acaulospora morrowiae]
MFPPSSPPSHLYIPPDVIEEILQYLKDDVSSLHTCILLNRLWCVLTIPYLWYNPFKTINHRITGRRNEIPRNRLLNRNCGISIIRQIVSRLGDDEKRALEDLLDVTLGEENCAKFDYPRFIKVLDYEKIQWSIIRWIEHVVDRDGKGEIDADRRLSAFEKREEILKIITGVLFNRGSAFRDINITYNPNFYCNSQYPSLIDLQSLDNVDSKFYQNDTLSMLQKFSLVHYSNSISPSSNLLNTRKILNNLTTISKHSHKLDYLNLQIHNETKTANLWDYVQAFCEVIKVQQKLRVLEVNDFFLDDDSSETASSVSDDEDDSMLDEISSSELLIETFRTSQLPKSLRYLKIKELSLSNFEFLLEILSICKNLETLELCDMFPPQSNHSNVSPLTYDFFYPTSNSQPPTPQISLKNLIILSNTPSKSRFTLSAIMTLLQLTNHSLTSFTLLQDISCSNSTEIYHTLSILCPNLTQLTLLLSPSTSFQDSLLSLLSTLKNLVNLTILTQHLHYNCTHTLHNLNSSNSTRLAHRNDPLPTFLTTSCTNRSHSDAFRPHSNNFTTNSYLCQYFSSPIYTNIHNLSQSLPKSLRQFTFDFFMNTKSFKLFFEQCGSDRLSVVGMLNKNMICDEYLEILSGYSEVRECMLELRCRRGGILLDGSNNNFHLSHRKSGGVTGKDWGCRFSKVGIEK